MKYPRIVVGALIVLHIAAAVVLPAQESAATAGAADGGQTTATASEAADSPVVIPQATDESTLRFEERDEQAAPESGGENVTAFGVSDLIRMIVVLALVVGAIYGLIALLKRVGSTPVDESDQITILATKALPDGANLHIVQVGEQVYMLGSGDAGVAMLAPVTDQETIDTLRLAHSEVTPVAQSSFRALLVGIASVGASVHGARSAKAGRAGGADGATKQGGKGGSQPLSFLRSQRQRIQKLG